MVAHLALGKGEEEKPYPGQPFAWGNMLIHHPPPLASFLDGDTCKLITYLCYIVWIIYKTIMYKYVCCRCKEKENVALLIMYVSFSMWKLGFSSSDVSVTQSRAMSSWLRCSFS